jgi:hypothetical protein
MPGRKRIFATTPAPVELLSPAPGRRPGGVVFHNVLPLDASDDAEILKRFQEWQGSFPNGSLPEFIVWEYLVGKRELNANIDFVYQQSFSGGRTIFGGFVLDYYFPNKSEGWLIQGERYHLLNPRDRATNEIVKAQLNSDGIRALELWESDLLTRPDFVMDAAWYRSEEIPTGARL